MEKQLPVSFILCTEEDIQKMNSKPLSLVEDQKEQLENSIEEPEENSVENFIKESEKVSI